MASVHRHPKSPYWFAAYRDALGRRATRSTRQEDRKLAQKVADAWELAANKARQGELTQEAATRVLSDIMESVSGERLQVRSVEAFLGAWMAERGVATRQRYQPIIDGFLASLDPRRRKASIGSVTPREVKDFRNAYASEGRGASTANFAVKVLRGAFNSAVRERVALSNPAEPVEMLAEQTEARLPFTDDELRAIYAKASPEWRGMILLGVHCGLRLVDAASLTWGAVNLAERRISLRPAKTKRFGASKDVSVALHADLIDYLSDLPSGVGLAPLFPALAGKKPGSAGGLSNAFADLMRAAGVVIPKGEAKQGKGRRFSLKSFHSLRHTFISRLANADVSADVRKLFVGHSTDEVHDRYTHLARETQARAVAKLASVI